MEQRGFGAMPTHRKCSCLQGRLGSYDSVLVGLYSGAFNRGERGPVCPGPADRGKGGAMK
jgi:hypothetical protein